MRRCITGRWATWARPEQIKVPLDPPAHILEELKKPRDYTADLKKLLASPNICSKRWVFEQYDSMVQTNTVQGPGGEAGVMRIKGSGTPGHERGLAMALAGNGRWCYLDPKLGAMHAVAEAARKVACTGATPVAATNCLNFGNPEKPEIMAQLSAAIDGIAEACTALGTPITGGNVSLYNETQGRRNLSDAGGGRGGDSGRRDEGRAGGISDERARSSCKLARRTSCQHRADRIRRAWVFGVLQARSSDSYGVSHPYSILRVKLSCSKCLATLAEARLISSASDICEGGLAVALAEAAMSNGIGVDVEIIPVADAPDIAALFGESVSQVIVTFPASARSQVEETVFGFSELSLGVIGSTVRDKFRIKIQPGIASDVGGTMIDTDVSQLEASWSDALESQLAEEVTA